MHFYEVYFILGPRWTTELLAADQKAEFTRQ